MKRANELWRVLLVAWVPLLGANQVLGQEDAPRVSRTLTVVVNEDGDPPQAAIEQIREQLKNAGLSNEQQEKILSQVEESLARSAAAGAKAEQAAKAAENAVKSATIGQLNMEDLQKSIQAKIKGRFQLGGSGTGASYRIGISVVQKQDEGDKEEDGDEDDGDENDGDEDDGDKDDEDEVEGLVIEQVMDDSPASKAGIQSGDVIVTVNGETLNDFTALQEAVQQAGESDKALVLMLRRDGKEKKIKVKPLKTEGSDVGFMQMELIPQQGVVVNGFPLPAYTFQGVSNHDELKNEIGELRKEIGELKKMVRKLLDK